MTETKAANEFLTRKKDDLAIREWVMAKTLRARQKKEISKNRKDLPLNPRIGYFYLLIYITKYIRHVLRKAYCESHTLSRKSSKRLQLLGENILFCSIM